MQLIVLGMHRSGTSAVTRLLNMAGAYFGPEGVATTANDENPKGFWERRDLRRICDGLLHAAGHDWWKVADLDPRAIGTDSAAAQLAAFDELLAGLEAHRPWVLKEPRLCLLLSVLRPALEVPVCIHVSREPVEVASSVAARNGFPLPVAVALWERYTLHSLAASADLPRYHVRHAEVLADPVGTLAGLLDWLDDQGVRGLRRPSEREITAFVDPGLHRQRSDADRRDELLNGRQAALAGAIDAGTLFDEHWATREPSVGGTEVLRAFEQARARDVELGQMADQIRLLEKEAVDAEAEAGARIEALRETLTAEVEQAARDAEGLELVAGDGVRRAERSLRALEASTLWRTTEQLMFLRQRLTPGVQRQERGQLTRIRSDLADVVQALDTRPRGALAHLDGPDGEDLGGGVVVRSAGPPPAPAAERTRPKVAVIAWDVGHNPLGRAYIMAELLDRRFDVELWGAQFDRYGSRLWAPLRQPEIPVHFFDGSRLPQHLDAMERVAERIDADAIWVSKPRFPSLALGVLAKRSRNRPLIVDVDDHELAFFGEEHGLELADLFDLGADELSHPFERAWTRACDPLIGEADAVTVSNVALQERYGGTIVPHARDERRFDPERYDREATRASLGVGPKDRLLLFGGTPRVHKGVIEILEALERLGDPRYKLALFGTSELAELRDRIGALERWIVPMPYQRFSDLAPIVGAADLACVLQDPGHPVTRYQMPAKVTDALAMEVPCLVADLPPLRPLIDAGVVHVHRAGEPLHERIAAIFNDPAGTAERAAAGRRRFLDEYSYEAVSASVAPVFDGLLGDPPQPSAKLGELVDASRRLVADDVPAPAVPARTPGSRRWRAAPGEQYDLVMFWKQNDSSIYGRRQDMFLEYLRRSGRFAKIVHFDNPVSPEKLYTTFRGAGAGTDQARLVVRQTLRRLVHRHDESGVTRRTFLHAGPRSSRLRLPRRSEYPDYVASVLERAGVGKRLTVFWVYPTSDDLPAVIDAFRPDLVVADVVDDNRTWYTPDSPHHERIERNYREVLARSDVVLANCGPVADAMSEFAADVHLVPNGCELPGEFPPSDPPPELASLSGPVIGYVGNLSDRIDIDLLDDLVRARPSWQFVFVGSTHLDQTILRLDRHHNAHFLGVRPYEQAKRLIQHLDVALIPHLDNEMTRSMNPLKAFVYCAAGVPVVSTPIANIEDLGSLITVATGAERFLEAIEDALDRGRTPADAEALRVHAWDTRVQRALTLIDTASGVTDQDPDRFAPSP